MAKLGNILRNTAFAIGLATAAGFSLWKNMPWPAVVAMVLLSGLLYRDYTRAVVKSCVAFIDGARIAKFGQFEIQADRSLPDASAIDLRQLMLRNLKPEELGLLFVLYPDKRHPLLNAAARNSVVGLRNRGWLAHDKAYLGDSTEIWLTDQGRVVLASVLPENSSPFGRVVKDLSPMTIEKSKPSNSIDNIAAVQNSTNGNAEKATPSLT
jgi:hypothetical protein